MSREAVFQDKLKELIQAASKFRFDGLEVSRVERDHPVDSREVDIAVFIRGGLPFLLIETKKKAEGKRDRGLFDPLALAVVGQAISYAALYGRRGLHVPYFATANPKSIAVFKTPKDLNEYVNYAKIEKRDYSNVIRQEKFSDLIKNYLIIREELKLTEEYIQNLLDRLAKDFLEKRALKVELSFALINQFRSFVEDLSEQCRDLLELKMKDDLALKTELDKMEKELGYKPSSEELVRMMSYVLMNKLIFYKVLEEKYKLRRLTDLDTSSSTSFREQLLKYFDEAVNATKDFEPVFKTGIYDMLPIPDDPNVMERINDFISFLDNVKVEEVGDLAGYIYEELIPPEERHRLGQFYTPPAICELITKWTIRSPEDIVLDPGCGSGGFLLQAYRRLLKLKTGRDVLPASKEVHERILNQLYAVDINPFPAHLTAVNLSMKNVRAPSSQMNVIVQDFFSIMPGHELILPYRIKTAAGEVERKITMPKKADAIVGNPPYTRWVEIPEKTKKQVLERLRRGRDLIGMYGLTPQVSRGVEPGIYTYWIMHATGFLKDGGKLGMIISNLWMQTDYGIGFGKFLLDNYKVKAIIDFTLRLFTALISTCVILLEKEKNQEKRLNNEVVFIHIPGTIESVNVEEILEVVESKKSDKFYVKVMKQGEIPADRKWMDVFFGKKEVYESNLLVKLSELFDASYGNIKYLVLVSTGKLRGVRNPGASEFHYLTPSKVKEFKLEKYAYPNSDLKDALIWPAITSARQAEFFTFTEDDWKQMYGNDEKCYMFIGHKPRSKLPEEVRKYVKWGETECVTRIRESRGGGRLANQTESAKVRAGSKEFYGWYDLGGVVPAPIFAIYQAWYKTRFILCRFPVAMYHALITLVPRNSVSLNEEQVNALLAYLNSSFIQYYVETHGRRSGGGIIGLEINIARDMPVLDVRKLTKEQVESLAHKFGELEAEARRIGGASMKEQIEKLKPKIYEIDHIIGEILSLKPEDVEDMQKTVEDLVERRIMGAKEAMPESVKGEAELRIKPPKKAKRKKEKNATTKQLDEFFEGLQSK